jgi:hypothetical protein
VAKEAINTVNRAMTQVSALMVCRIRDDRTPRGRRDP